MLTIPVPFCTAAIFFGLAIGLFTFRHHFLIRREIIVLAFASALLSLLVALRWSISARFPLFLMPIVASFLAPLAWFCFYSPMRKQIFLHLIGVGLVTLLSLLFPILRFDSSWLVVLLMFGYGGVLMVRGFRTDDFTWAKLTQTYEVSAMAIAMGAWLWFITSIDFAVAWDFAKYSGQHAPQIVSWSHVFLLLVFAYVTFSVIRLQMPIRLPPPKDKNVEYKNNLETSEQQLIIDQLSMWLIENAGYQDPNLSLDKMARKLCIPSRQISVAINKVAQQSISQWVNTIRIDQAKKQLQETAKTVTAIMYDCGYITKSNFNKEFKYHTGMSPSEFRRDNNAKES